MKSEFHANLSLSPMITPRTGTTEGATFRTPAPVRTPSAQRQRRFTARALSSLRSMVRFNAGGEASC